MEEIHNITHEKFNSNINSTDNIHNLLISDLNYYPQFKLYPSDDPLLTAKKVLLEQQNIIKDRYALTEVEYLLKFTNATEEIIHTVSKELHCGNLDDNDNNNYEVMDNLDSYVEFSVIEVQTI